MNKRIDIIDALKGFAILLVVFGHAIQSSIPTFDENICFRIIYSFHMPLFMFLCGLVASYSSDVRAQPYLKKKFMALVVPFTTWYAVGYFATGAYHTITIKTYIGRVLLSPDYGLWFLWILFLNYCFFVMTVKLEIRLGLLAYLMMILLIELTPLRYAGFGLLKIHFVYFIAGYLLMKYNEVLKKYLIYAQVTAVIIFPALVSQWHRTKGFSFSSQINDWAVSYGYIPHIPQLVSYGCIFALAASGIVLSYIFISNIRKIFLYKYFCKLGNYTFDIYVSHLYFLFGIGLGVTRIISSAFAALIVSLMLSLLLIRKIEILNYFFLGNRVKTAGYTIMEN